MFVNSSYFLHNYSKNCTQPIVYYVLIESKISCMHIKKTEGLFRYQIWKRSAKYRWTNSEIFWYINLITTSFGGDWPSNDLEKHCQKSNERFEISWCHCKTNKPYKCLTCWEWICCEWLCLTNRDFTQKITIFFLFH